MTSLLVLLALMPHLEEPKPREKPTELVWFADLPLYRHPVADPRAPHSGVHTQFHLRREQDAKIETVLGNYLSIVRWPGDDHAVEIGVEGAAFARFNAAESLDMDGVDFRFGWPFVYRRGPLAAKLHFWHITSHLGDEFIENTGRKRIRYARNELALGSSYDLTDDWRVYGEAGYGLWIGAPNQRWRAMWGLEGVADPLQDAFPHVFTAANFTSFESVDWDPQLNLQLGVWARPGNLPHGLRVGFEYFRGNAALTQFFRDREEFWGFGFWMLF
ncbi:MAG: DUF1207 domain-containing protein [Candidatus Binatia bacterium]